MKIPFLGRLGRRSLEYLVGEAGSKGAIYLLLILLAANTDVSDFGLVNLFITLAGLISVVMGLGLPDGAFRMHFQPRGRDRVLGAAFLGILGASVVGSGLLLLAAGTLAEMLGVPRDLVRLTGLVAPALALRQVWLAVLKARQEGRAFAVVRLVEPLLLVLFIVPWIGHGRVLEYRLILWAYTAAMWAVAAAGLIVLRRRPGIRWSPEALAGLLGYSLPLVFHSVAMTGLATVDQVVIQHTLGSHSTGTYAFAYRFGMAMSLIVMAGSTAWAPWVIGPDAGGKAKATPLEAASQRLFGGFLLAASSLSLSLPLLARWIGGEAYEASPPLIPIIVYGYLWLGVYGLLVAYLIRDRRTKLVAVASATAFLFNLVLNYLTVPRYGIEAAAWTTVASYALLCLIVSAFLGRHFKEVPIRRLTTWVLLFGLLLPALLWAARAG